MKTIEYKDTEVGRIPADWDVKKFSEVFNFLPNNTYAREFMTEASGEAHNVHYGDVLVKYGSILNFEKDTVPYLDSERTHYQIKALIQDGDVIIADTAEDETVGKAVEIIGLNGRKAISGLHTMLCRPKENLFAQGYLGYYINSSAYHNQLLPLMVGTKVSSISKTAILDTYIAIPPIEQQKEIAKAFFEIDSLLAELNSKIEKKRLVKEGLMQQLLTGKTRLPGYDGEWIEKQIKDMGYTFSGLTGKSKNDFGKGNAKYITFLNVLNNPILKTTQFEKVVVEEGERQNRVLKGDLFFNTSSETPEEVGICAILNDDIPNLYLNSFCFGFRLTDPDISGLFLSYYFRSKIGRDIMSKLAQGATRYNLSKDSFNQIYVSLPSLEEQCLIVDIIKNADAEIQSMEAERDKYILIKQGMMQELLTGKTRLI